MQLLDTVCKEVTPLTPTMFDERIVDIHQNASPIFLPQPDATTTAYLLRMKPITNGGSRSSLSSIYLVTVESSSGKAFTAIRARGELPSASWQTVGDLDCYLHGSSATRGLLKVSEMIRSTRKAALMDIPFITAVTERSPPAKSRPSPQSFSPAKHARMASSGLPHSVAIANR